MAAGLGFKDFTTGEVLTAADVDGYLMQGIWVFASNAARDAAVTAPAEGNFAFTKDTNSLWYYDGAAWVASGATGDIEGVTAGVGISGGGTSGTVTVTNSMATAIDAKGDLIGGTGADTFARLAVGANDTVLTADSTAATGLKWAAPAGGGGMTLLASGSLAASATGFDLTSISGAYNELVLYIANLSADATGGIGYATVLLLNNDTGANYSITGTQDTNIVNISNSSVGFTLFSTEDASTKYSCVVRIPNYTDTTSSKIMTSVGQLFTNKFPSNRAGIWTATPAAIDRLTLKIGGGAYDGGTYKLYGVK